MTKKITYLVGAGASIGTIPTINIFTRAIDELKREFEANRTQLKQAYKFHLDIANFDLNIEKFIQDCTVFSLESAKHNSIDTYAKKLLITGKLDEFNQLKGIITSVVIYSTLTREIDPRYDGFFSAILANSANEFIGDVRILSWNYDYLFEKAYSLYSLDSNLRQNQMKLHVFPYGVVGNQQGGSFKIFKINGTTGYYNIIENREINIQEDFGIVDHFSSLNSILKYYGETIRKDPVYKCQLSFAFEREGYPSVEDSVIKAAMADIQNTDVLTVIGYSFPFVNRKFDRELLKIIPRKADELKIFIQNPEFAEIKEKMLSLNPEFKNSQFEVNHFNISAFRMRYNFGKFRYNTENC